MNKLYYELLLNGKGNKIKQNVRYRLEFFFNKSLKCLWGRKYLDKENKGKWNFFMYLDLEKGGGQLLFLLFLFIS